MRIVSHLRRRPGPLKRASPRLAPPCDLAHSLEDRFDFAGGHDKAGVAVVDVLLHAGVGGDDGRQAGAERLEAGVGEIVLPAGVDVNVGAAQVRQGVAGGDADAGVAAHPRVEVPPHAARARPADERELGRAVAVFFEGFEQQGGSLGDGQAPT